MNMKKIKIILSCIVLAVSAMAQNPRTVLGFNSGWKFNLGDNDFYKKNGFNDAPWRTLDLPHDWSIEGKFDSIHPAGNAGGALPGGVGWYRKTFTLPPATNKRVYIEFDGVYRNSEVWMNEKYLGKWPNGYTSFRYELTPYLKTGKQKNTIAVRVDNSQQPNSRWYSGSGIYRDVRLVTTTTTAISHWGVFVTTPKVSPQLATVNVALDVEVKNNAPVTVHHKIFDEQGRLVSQSSSLNQPVNKVSTQSLQVQQPKLLSVKLPHLYKLETTI